MTRWRIRERDSGWILGLGRDEGCEVHTGTDLKQHAGWNITDAL